MVLANPYPNGLIQPSGRNEAALLTATQGQTITLPLTSIAFPYVQQWNFNIGRELGNGMMFEIGYAGLKGTHLPLAGNPNINQLPTGAIYANPGANANFLRPYPGMGVIFSTNHCLPMCKNTYFFFLYH